MSEKNSWTKWLVATLFTVLFTAFTTLTTHVIANEEKRVKENAEIRKELNACVKEQMETNQQILVAQAKQQVILERILLELKK